MPERLAGLRACGGSSHLKEDHEASVAEVE